MNEKRGTPIGFPFFVHKRIVLFFDLYLLN